MSRRVAELEIELARLTERIHGLDRLTDEKFVKYRTLLEAQAAQVKLALDAAKEAISKAEIATEKRFDSVNEFRQQLGDQANTFIPRKEAEQRISALADRMETAGTQVAIGDAKLDERIKALEQGSSNLQGRLWALGIAMTVVVIVVNVAIGLLTR